MNLLGKPTVSAELIQDFNRNPKGVNRVMTGKDSFKIKKLISVSF